MARILTQRFVPICNYKDFLSVASDPHDEIIKIDEFRDNDRFSREIAEILGAEALILATNGVDGFEDEFGRVVHEFPAGRLDDMEAADYQSSQGGTGGIVAKLAEAAVAADSGIRSFVCSADADFEQILTGQRICTEVIQ
jgi:glutamate 5-kinase